MRAAAGGPGAFPWDDVIATGLGRLRLAPKDFWLMTPREFERAASVLHRSPAAGRMERGDLAALMQAFPDTFDGGR